MEKKQLGQYLLVALSFSLIYACGPKQVTPPPEPIQQQPIQSLDPNAPIPGLDDLGGGDLNPPATTPTQDPNTPPTETPPTDTPAASATPAPSATPTADPNASPTPTPTPTATATPVPITCDVKISGDLNVLSGSTRELTAKEECSDSSVVADTYNWSSADTSIATVDANGKVSGVKAGTTTITATSKTTASKKSAVQFKVSSTCQITLSGDLFNNPNIGIGSAKQLTGAVKCSDGTNPTNISFSSSDSGVAVVNGSGLVEGLKKGTAKINAVYGSDPTVKTELNITVSDPLGNDTRDILAEGKLLNPKGIAVKNGRLYVSHLDDGTLYDDGRVKVFDLQGNQLAEIKGSFGDGLPVELTGVATDGSRVWFTNRIPYGQAQNLVYSFDTTGAARQNARLGLTGATGTDFKDIAVDPSTSTIYISSGGVKSVIKASYDATGIKSESQQLCFAGGNLSPAGICVDNFGNLIMTNQGATHTIMKFGKDGAKVLEFNTTGKNAAGPVTSAIIDVAYDHNNGGIYYVLAQVSGANVILRYDNSGNFVRSFGGSAGMPDPTSIAVGEDGSVYIADKGKKAIYQFAPGK